MKCTIDFKDFENVKRITFCTKKGPISLYRSSCSMIGDGVLIEIEENGNIVKFNKSCFFEKNKEEVIVIFV